jgi:Tfp pilus assembly protein PilZ
MKKRPLSVLILSYLYFASPVLVLIYLMLTGNMEQVLNWRVLSLMILTPVVGYGIWTIRVWGYFLLIAHSLLLIASNIASYMMGDTSLPLWFISSVSVILLGVIILFVRKEVKTPYFNPEVRWWESASRYYYHDMKVLVKEHNSDKLIFDAKSFDLSETGVFVTTDRVVNIGEKYSFELILVNNSILYTDGEVVWVNPKNKSMFPKGFGCWFVEPNGLFRKRIRYHLKDIRAKMREIRVPR